MAPPLISYVTFNRLGLTIKNLASILDSTDDFEMHIIDNNSMDDTWDYIQSLNDPRIKSKTHIEINTGQIYALNLNLLKRKPEQYFITIDNDVFIKTKDWISRFMKVFKKFPDVGLLGVEQSISYAKTKPSLIHKRKSGTSFLQIKNTAPNVEHNYVPGYIMCLKPKLIKNIGYFCEENAFGDMELSYRVNNYTNFKTGFVTDVKIEIPQTTDCNTCEYQNQCTINRRYETCFTKHKKLYKNDEFRKKNRWKLDETIIDMKSGARPAYCASSNDKSSLENHVFNMEWAIENFKFYINNAN